MSLSLKIPFKLNTIYALQENDKENTLRDKENDIYPVYLRSIEIFLVS